MSLSKKTIVVRHIVNKIVATKRHRINYVSAHFTYELFNIVNMRRVSVMSDVHITTDENDTANLIFVVNIEIVQRLVPFSDACDRYFSLKIY